MSAEREKEEGREREGGEIERRGREMEREGGERERGEGGRERAGKRGTGRLLAEKAINQMPPLL